MRTKSLGLGAAALFILAVAACSAGGNSPTPVYPIPGGGTSGTPVSAPAVGGFSGYVTVTASTAPSPAPSAAFTATFSLTAPSGTTALVTAPQVYMTITAGTGGVTIKSLLPVITFNAPVPSGLNAYMAYWTGTDWATLGGKGSLASGTTAQYTFTNANFNPYLTLAAGQSVVLVFYEGSYAYPSPVPTPTPTPTPVPTPTPIGNVVANGDFESGLASWSKCSYQHEAYNAPVNATPMPFATATQAPVSVGSPSPVLSGAALDPYANTATPPANYNPDQLSAPHPDFGTTSALTGNMASMANSATGICQAVTVPPSGQLKYWVYEGGTAYNFYNGDQEMQVLDSTGTSIVATEVVELNCYYDSTNFPVLEPISYPTSGCFPTNYGGTSAYVDWTNGGYWVQRGPYDLSSLAGQNVTLFFGVWSNANHQPAPLSYANYMYVDDVTLQPAT